MSDYRKKRNLQLKSNVKKIWFELKLYDYLGYGLAKYSNLTILERTIKNEYLVDKELLSIGEQVIKQWCKTKTLIFYLNELSAFEPQYEADWNIAIDLRSQYRSLITKIIEKIDNINNKILFGDMTRDEQFINNIWKQLVSHAKDGAINLSV